MFRFSEAELLSMTNKRVVEWMGRAIRLWNKINGKG